MQRPIGLEVQAARRDLVLLVVVVVGLARLLHGPLSWVVAILLLAATLLGALQVLGELDTPDTERGVPVESLILPAVAAIGCLGAIGLVPVGVWLVPALIATAFLVDRTLVLEERILVSNRSLTPEDRSAVLVATLLVGFVGFVGAGTLVPGGLALRPGEPVAPQSGSDLLLLAVADAVVAGLLGYRAAALRVVKLSDVLWSAATYAIAIAIGAAALRAMAIPRLIGPALLTLAFYLWDALHGASPSRRRDPRWIWQTGLLLALGVLVLGWNVLIKG
ncbi:MAG TPA: hypothetical protein VGQ64_10535 [Candidatus Limnocylindrales bacterium]|nr:hypothetical protein [Candidatus Limnocylindrales bacterium]